MKFTPTLFLTIILTFFCKTIHAQENPFMDMAGKKYAEYSHDFRIEDVKFHRLTDTIEQRKVICQLEEVVRKTGSIEWKLHAAYFELELFSIKRKLYGDTRYPYDKTETITRKLLEEAEKSNVLHLELLLRQAIIECYWEFKMYEPAFELYIVQEKRLDEISSEDVPEKCGYFRKIADAHYYFKNYSQAIFYYNKVLKEKDNVRTVYPKQQARNGLGLCYRFGYNDLDRSDSSFLSILHPDNIHHEDDFYYEIWNGIAKGNLGRNMLMREEYDKAIPLLKNSIENMVKHGDYPFATGVAINLAMCYLKKGNIAEAKSYIDLAQDYYQRNPREEILPRIYELLSKYYVATGNAKLSMAYMDSMLTENKRHEAQFSALQMMRVAQRQHLSEQKLQEEQLNVEKVRNTGYRISLLIIIIALLAIGSVLVYLFVIYRKRQAAYRELVRKSQEWAQVPHLDLQKETGKLNENGEQNGVPDETDFLIMKEIEKLMSEDKLYRSVTLSVELLAQKLSAKRHYISNAINHCTKKSFNTFVNEYRIKEAVQLLSQTGADTFTIDTIAYNVGFNNRINFYRVFKKMTGLSPVEFRNLV